MREFMKIKYKHSTEKGFSLIELLLVLGIISIAFIGLLSYFSKMADQARAETAGEQIAELGKALGNYIVRESGTLQGCMPAGTVIQVTATPLLTQATGTTTVGACTLNNRQVLPSTWNNINSFRTGYQLFIRNNASNSLGALVLTDAPINDPGSSTAQVRYDWLGAAMRKAGSQSGITFIGQPTSLTGLGGGWALANTEYPNINKVGLLGYRVGYQGSYDDIYLRLDGAYPMRGNLNMGNYNVNNATDINFNGWLNGNNALLNNLKTGYISNSGNIQTNTMTATTSITTGGREANPMPIAWTGDFLHTWNIYAEGTIGTGSNGVVQASMDNAGLIKANNIRLTTVTCAGAGATTGLTAAQLTTVRGKDCNTTAYDGMLTDRLPQYVSKGAKVVTDGEVITKPVCNATTGGTNSARIIVTPQIQNTYGDYDVQVNLFPQPNNSINVVVNRSAYTADQIQVYAIDNGATWTVRITSAMAQKYGATSGYMGLAETFCDFGG